MTRFLAWVISVSVLSPMARAGQQPTVFRAAGDLVRVFVTVTDRDGHLITTLRQDDFEVRDQGKPQRIVQFDNTPLPIRLIVMLDVSGSMEGNLPLLRNAAAQLFARLGPDDAARVGSFGYEISISPAFTRDSDELQAALPQTIAPDAPTFLWRALDVSMNAFGDIDDKRRVILVLSDGKDSGPHAFLGQRPVSQAEVIDRARREDVMIYAIGMRSRGRPPRIDRGVCATAPFACLQATMLADVPDPGLARVAQETGGGYTEIRAGEDLGRAFTSVADQLHSQYLLGFVPPHRDGKTHEISVRTRGLKARARRSYVALNE
jgi:VWFA-related protein